MFSVSYFVCRQPYVQSEGLIIVVSGELAVYAEDTETWHLIDGDFFGELSLVTDREVRVSSVVALTPCLVGYLRSYLANWFVGSTNE